jgi:hypothetical protein
MKFMLTFSWKPDKKKQDEGIARFKKSGGLPPNLTFESAKLAVESQRHYTHQGDARD